jgi:chromosome partitioning protein
MRRDYSIFFLACWHAAMQECTHALYIVEATMAIIIGIVSQKGGVGKSTIARLVAREFAAQGWQVKIGDLDIGQATSFHWRSRRLQSALEPDISIEQFGRVDQALKAAAQYDVLILDGAPHATQATKQIADTSDLVIIPTGLAIDDLEPGVRLAHDLAKDLPRQKIVFALCRVGNSKPEVADARRYLEEAGYAVLVGELSEQVAYRRASDEGRAASETRYPSLNRRAEVLAQSIVNRIAELNG